MQNPNPQTPSIQPPLRAAAPIPFLVLQSPFLRRTAMATVLTLLVVGSALAAPFDPRWAGYYLLAGAWALVNFALLAMLLKAICFDGRRWRGLAWAALKLTWLGLLVAGAMMLHERSGMAPARLAGALIAGVSTPLAVAFLRALGAALEGRRLASRAFESLPQVTPGEHAR